MTSITSVSGFNNEPNAGIGWVDSDAVVECHVCMETYPISTFTICVNGHLNHEKDVLKIIEYHYSIGEIWAESEHFQCCSICKESIIDINLSDNYMKLLNFVQVQALSKKIYNIKLSGKEIIDIIRDRMMNSTGYTCRNKLNKIIKKKKKYNLGKTDTKTAYCIDKDKLAVWFSKQNINFL